MKSRKRTSARSSSFSSPRGMALLRDPLLNKGTAFTERERDTLGLRGLLPAHLLSMKAQTDRMLTNLRQLPNDLDKYVGRCHKRYRAKQRAGAGYGERHGALPRRSTSCSLRLRQSFPLVAAVGRRMALVMLIA